jgi:hypothetical protein
VVLISLISKRQGRGFDPRTDHFCSSQALESEGSLMVARRLFFAAIDNVAILGLVCHVDADASHPFGVDAVFFPTSSHVKLQYFFRLSTRHRILISCLPLTRPVSIISAIRISAFAKPLETVLQHLLE